jgi:hypothetical protein
MTKLVATAGRASAASTGAPKGGSGGGGDVEQALSHTGCAGSNGVPLSTPSRLILPFAPMACCSGGDGLLDCDAVPPELAARGVQQSQWFALLAALRGVQRGAGRVGCCGFVLATLLAPLATCALPVLCVVERRYQLRVAAWVAHANAARVKALT